MSWGQAKGDDIALKPESLSFRHHAGVEEETERKLDGDVRPARKIPEGPSERPADLTVKLLSALGARKNR